MDNSKIYILIILTIGCSGCITSEEQFSEEQLNPAQVIDYELNGSWEVTGNESNFIQYRHKKSQEIGISNLYPEIIIATKEMPSSLKAINRNESRVIEEVDLSTIVQDEGPRVLSSSEEILEINGTLWKNSNVSKKAIDRNATGEIYTFFTYSSGRIIYIKMLNDGQKERYPSFLKSIRQAEIKATKK